MEKYKKQWKCEADLEFEPKDWLVDFRELFRHVRHRPGMHGLDGRACSMLAFVHGCDTATDGQLLQGIHEWTQARLGRTGKTSIIWDGQILYETIPFFAEEQRLLRDLSDEEGARYVAAIFDALDDLLDEHPHIYEPVVARQAG